jgi:diguanylate cyclase (GGDEF)-like protein
MVYQRHMPDEELFAAQLELLMQHGRVASMVSNGIGALAVIAVLWHHFPVASLLYWGSGVLVLLLLRSLHMSSALAERSYLSRPRRLFWRLVLGSAATGAIWACTYIFVSATIPATLQYLLLLVIVMIAAISLAVMVVVREYFLAFLFSSLFPIAWWSLLHLWDQPHNLVIGLLLLGVSALLVVASNGIHETFRSMLTLNWQQQAMSRELGQITASLRDRNRQLRDARQKLTELANVDELTGLGNRRLANRVLREELNRARRSGTSLAVILLDVDYFKTYNDSYGHPAGDAVLRRLGDLMRRAAARAGEVVARYGGEEFIVIVPNTSQPEAQRTAERLRRLVEDESIPHRASGISDRVTISLGLVTVQPADDTDPEELIDRADAALYCAKRDGRNRVAVA